MIKSLFFSKSGVLILPDMPRTRRYRDLDRKAKLQVLTSKVFPAGNRADATQYGTLFEKAVAAVVAERPQQERNSLLFQHYWGMTEHEPTCYEGIAAHYKICRSSAYQAIARFERYFKPIAQKLHAMQ